MRKLPFAIRRGPQQAAPDEGLERFAAARRVHRAQRRGDRLRGERSVGQQPRSGEGASRGVIEAAHASGVEPLQRVLGLLWIAETGEVARLPILGECCRVFLLMGQKIARPRQRQRMPLHEVEHAPADVRG